MQINDNDERSVDRELSEWFSASGYSPEVVAKSRELEDLTAEQDSLHEQNRRTAFFRIPADDIRRSNELDRLKYEAWFELQTLVRGPDWWHEGEW